MACNVQTGKPGGRNIGRKMAHYIIPGGLFEQAFEEMPRSLLITFKPLEDQATDIDPKKIEDKKERDQKKLKTKYTCLGCSMTVWGKRDLFINCGQCNLRLVVIDDFGKKT